MADPQTAGETESRTSLFGRIIRTIRSLRFAIVLMILIALACILGTLVQQEPYGATKAVERYGEVLGPLVALLGLNQLYGTYWFLTLLSLFALSTTLCAFRRRRLKARAIGSMIVHASILFIVAGVIARGLVGKEGAVTLAEGETVHAFRHGNDQAPLGFHLRLDDFQVVRHGTANDAIAVQSPDKAEPRLIPVEVGKTVELESGEAKLEVLRRILDFKMDGKRVYSASDKPANPALQVRVTGPGGTATRWLFARLPDFHGHGTDTTELALRYVWRDAPVKAFESHVTVFGEDIPERQAVIRVNEPLKAGRYTLFQLSYDPQTEAASTLEVVYDPGVPLVFVGFVLMPAGMAFTLYVRPLLERKARKDV